MEIINNNDTSLARCWHFGEIGAGQDYFLISNSLNLVRNLETLDLDIAVKRANEILKPYNLSIDEAQNEI